MKKVYHLSSCSTCIRILKELKLEENGFELQDINTNKITPLQLEEMKELSGSYEALFSRRAMLYKSMNLSSKNLEESDYKNLILEHYTFLKRPVILLDKKVFIGNSKKTVDAVAAAL